MATATATATATTTTLPSKKAVSFGDPIVHVVPNLRLELSSPQQRKKVWYGALELAEFARDEFFFRFEGTLEEAIVAYEASYLAYRYRLLLERENRRKLHYLLQDLANRWLATYKQHAAKRVRLNKPLGLA